MLSRSRIKYIQSLLHKKYRKQYNCFIAEGNKSVSELINSNMRIKQICATPSWIDANSHLLSSIASDITSISEDELRKISALKNPSDVLAVVEIPDTEPDPAINNDRFSLVLDEIQDPGNLGTIIRIADWFGIENIFTTAGTADPYNPKVIQATMGSIARVRLWDIQPEDFFHKYPDQPVYGAFLSGENVFTKKIEKKNGFIIIGNEGKGISETLESFVTDKISIPSVGKAESLNAAVATGIIVAVMLNKS